MLKLLGSLCNAVHRGFICEVEGCSRWNVFDQSMQDWVDDHLPWSGLLLGLIGVGIGVSIVWLIMALAHTFYRT